MKPVRSSVKKTKSAKKKSKSSGRSEAHLDSQISQKENTDLKIISKKSQDDANWESGQEEKNEKELQAVKDLCALSEEESESLSADSNFQKLWMDSGKGGNKDLPWTGKENDLCNPSLTAIGNEKSEKRLYKRKSEPRVVSRLEVANILQTRNFLKENMFFRTKRDWGKEKKLLGKAELDKLLNDRNAEISNSLRELKEKTQERHRKVESEVKNQRIMVEKYSLKKFCHNREYSREERISLWQDSSKDPTSLNEENNTFIPKGIDAKTLDLIHSARPYSSNKAIEKNKTQNTKVLRHEIIELIEKFEKSNRVVSRDPGNIRIKKASSRFPEDHNPEATNILEARRGSEPKLLTREAYNPPIRGREVLASEETPAKDLRSQVQQVLSERFGSQPDDNSTKFGSKTFYKVTEEKGTMEKPPLSSRNIKRDGSTGKVRLITSSKNPNSRRIEKYSFVTRDCSSLPQSLVDEQIDSSKDLQHNKIQNGEIIISSCQNIITKDRPVTASLESPQRRNIIKILNYFRNCGETRNSSGNSVLKKLLQNSNQKHDRTETRLANRLADSDFGVKLPDSFRAPVGENNNLGSNYKKSSIKRNSMVSMKTGTLSGTKNFREMAISTLQRAPSATFLQAIGKKLN